MNTTTHTPNHIEIVQSMVTTHAAYVQSRQVADRARELASYARLGYVLMNTTSVPGDDHVLFIDTLTRQTS
ncbi:hypothetical protein [Microbacterium sp. SLBN-111]|uniref:hypothetical protein n=1 Tax=Microbacterium sp. SLBN-111 TaxID=3377733 RepID=UPI003C756F25